MSIGPERARLRSYLTGAKHESTANAGSNWTSSADILDMTAQSIRTGAQRVRDGNGTSGGLSGVTAQAVLDAFTTSAISMQDKAVKIKAAGEALQETAEVMRRAEEAEATMAVLEQPTAYSPPSYSPGYQPTPAEIIAEGDKRSAANAKMSTYNTQRAEQEGAASDWSQKMDTAFLAAIPPMQEIHGEPDPTEPPPPGPGGPGAPGTAGTAGTPGAPGTPGTPGDPEPKDPKDPRDPDPQDPDPHPDPHSDPDPKPGPDPTGPTPLPHPNAHPGPSTTVIGSSQSGITYNPTGGGVSAPVSAGTGPSAGASAAALGAAGGAGGMAGGAIRPGAVPTSPPRGATPVRAIGSTGRAGSPGALSRSAASAGSAGRAGSAGGRGASAGSTSGRGAAGGRGGAGGRSAGSSAGSRSGGRSSSGARGTGAGGSGKGARKGEDEKTLDRDSLVYDQDWLGADDVAPGVLD